MQNYLVAPASAGLFAGVVLILSLSSTHYVIPDNLTEAERNTVMAETAKLRTINADPYSINAGDYPKIVGVTTASNLTLIDMYFCSDLCPEYARVILIYAGIDNGKECATLHGIALTDIAWGGYMGCTPLRCSDLDPEISREQFFENAALRDQYFEREYDARNTVPHCHN